jgi:hypothetical protein
MQIDDGKERLISCHSQTLRGAEKNYDNYNCETLAVFYNAEQNHSYFWGGKVDFFFAFWLLLLRKYATHTA